MNFLFRQYWLPAILRFLWRASVSLYRKKKKLGISEKPVSVFEDEINMQATIAVKKNDDRRHVFHSASI